MRQETQDERLARKAQELVDEATEEPIAVGSLTIHIHEGRVVRVETRRTMKLDAGSGGTVT